MQDTATDTAMDTAMDTATQLSQESNNSPRTPWVAIDPEPVPVPAPAPSMKRDIALLRVGQSALVPTRKMPRIYTYAKRLGLKLRAAKVGPSDPGKTRIWRIE